MEKDRKTRVIAIIALCVAVVGLSIGFAAFTRDLNIQFSDSNVNISGDLDVKFLASADPDDTSTIVNGIGAGKNSDGSEILDESIIVNPVTISSDGLTLSGVGGTFNNKDQGFVYNLYIYNNSEYDAYLKSVDFLNYSGVETNKVCTSLEGTNQGMVDDACEDIHVLFDVGDVNVVDTSRSDFSSIKIPKGKILLVGVLILYAGDVINYDFFGTEGSAILPNGDFKVNFGDIKFNFSSLEG